jgi:N-hydroxyarylamine O-acetyltransferase
MQEGEDAHVTSRITTTEPDLLAYLERIHYDIHAPLDEGRSPDSLEPSLQVLQEVHEAHMLAVPFENLSIHYGEHICLDEEWIHDKIVRRHRGGFCYELNGLFARLLLRLGFTVTLLSAEVAQEEGGYSPEFDHLTLLIHQLAGSDWLADVGFGDSFRRPLCLRADIEQEGADGQLYRLRQEYSAPAGADRDAVKGARTDPEAYTDYWIVQQLRDDGQWESQYRFTLRPHVLVDFTERCEYQQTDPESHFTQKRICSLALPEGRISLSDRRLITTIAGQRTERVVESEEEYRKILAERFGIVM